MRIILQRVAEARVRVGDDIIGEIGRGYLLLAGVMEGDGEAHAHSLAEKIVKLRLFEGEDGKINDRSLLDIGGEALVVSQFTLTGKTEKGNRPDYTAAARPEVARPLIDAFTAALRAAGVKKVAEGRFGAHMRVELTNDGPVTLVLEK